MSKFKVSTPSHEKIQEITSLAVIIENAVHNDQDCEHALKDMSRLTGSDNYDRDYFKTLQSHMSLETFAQHAAYPAPKAIPNISQDDLIEIVELAQENIADPSLDYYMALFDKNVTMPAASNLLFYPPEDASNGGGRDGGKESDIAAYDPSAAEIVDYALSYKPRT